MRFRLTAILTVLFLSTFLLTNFATAQVNFTSTHYGPDTPVNGVVTGDFNRDGKPDIAVLNGQSAPPAATVFLATTPGHYPATGTSYPVHDSPAQVRTADVNNDGKLDLVIAFSSSTPTISILLGNGDGTFTPGPDVTTAHSAGSFDLGDFNHDGKLDMAVVECDSSNVCDMQAYLGSGTGTFTPGYKIQMTGQAGSISAQDLNGDGNLDLILIRTNNVLIFGGDGTGRFPVFTKFTPPTHCTDPSVCTDGLESVVVADFNNDQRLDFAVLQGHFCPDPGPCGDNTVYVYKNNGSYSFALANHFQIGNTAGGQLLAVDLNGDQNIDLLGWDGFFRSPYITLERGSGNFTFTVESTNLPVSDPAQIIARDLNLDSRHDAIVADYGPNDDSMIVALNTNAFTTCAPPSSANLAAKICGPANNASVASPVLVKASGNSPAGIQRLEVWIDGVKKYQKWNDQVAKKFTLAAGSHRIAVVAVDMYKGTAKSAVMVNVH